MAINYPLALPDSPGFRSFNFGLNSAVAVLQSPYTFATQVQVFDGVQWVAEVTLPPMTREQAEPWLAFLAALRGRAGTFLLGDPRGALPQGVASGSPKVNGASQTGTTLLTKGWTNSITGILLAGDYFSIANRMYKVMTDANSDGSGLATLDIMPPLRESPGNDVAITTTNCKATFRLPQDNIPLYSTGIDGSYNVGFSAIEAI